MIPWSFYKTAKVEKAKVPVDFKLNEPSKLPVDFTYNKPQDEEIIDEDLDTSPWAVDYTVMYQNENDDIVNPFINIAIERSKSGEFEHLGTKVKLDNTPKGWCTYGPSTFFKELGLQGSFWNTPNNPETATSTNIDEKGFTRVWKGNFDEVKSGTHKLVLKPGDLMITYGVKNDGKNSTHIAMWNGDNWVSDFILKGALVYNKERKGDSGYSVEIYRLDPQKIIEKAEKGMKVENKKSTKETDLIGDEDAFNNFLITCPPNLLKAKITNGREDYRMRRYWELFGKPFNFWEGVDKGMFVFDKKDNKFHANSVAKNEETGEYEFMKYPDHETVHMETEWYKLGKVYPEEGEPFLLTPEHGEKYEEWLDFKNNYDLDESGEFFKYIPKKKLDVPKDEKGAKIIVIEKEMIEEPKEEKDPLKCLLCSIMNALGHRHHAFSELRPDKLTDIFGGNAEIVIELGGPEKAYNEDSFIEMIKDILPAISTSKKYKKEDILKIRSEKASHGTSMKRLLALMDDDKILKAFNGMLFYKAGGEIIFEAEGGELKGLTLVEITIGDLEFKVYEAKTEEERVQGLRGVTDLKLDEGMIFYWNKPQDDLVMTMRGCKISLRMVFFDEDLEILETIICKPNEDNIQAPEGTKYVVELHPDTSISKDAELDFPGDDDEYVMLVLGSDGSILMQLKGGERIFSRPNTKMLLKWAKLAYNSDNPADYKRLGKLIFKYLDLLDNRDPEYVQLDSKKE